MPSKLKKLWLRYRDHHRQKQKDKISARKTRVGGNLVSPHNRSILSFPNATAAGKSSSRSSLKKQRSVAFVKGSSSSRSVQRTNSQSITSFNSNGQRVYVQGTSDNVTSDQGTSGLSSTGLSTSNIDDLSISDRSTNIRANSLTQTANSVILNTASIPENRSGTVPAGSDPSVSSLRRGLSNVLSFLDISPWRSSSKDVQTLHSGSSLVESNSGLFSRSKRQVHPSTTEYGSLRRSKSVQGCLSILSFTTRTQGQQLSLNDLPSELIFHICSYLPRDASFVSLRCSNRRLNRLLTSDAFIRTNCLRICDDLKPKLLLNVLSISCNLRILNVAGCLSVTDQFLIYLSKNCRSITDIDVSGCVMVTDLGLEKIAHYLRAIERLSVANIRQVTCEGLIRLMTQHTNTIKALDISCCFGLEESAFRLSYLGEFCPNLEELQFRWSIEHGTIISMWETRMSQLCQLCPKLNHLDLSCSPSRDIKDILCTVAANCLNMRCLKLSRCCVRDDSLLKLSSLSNLQQLDLSRSPELSGVSLVFALRQLPLIRSLNLSGCCKLNDASMAPLLSALPCLRELYMRDCYDIGDEGLSQAPSLSPSLCFLDVSGTMLTAQGAHSITSLTGSHFILITENCPLLSRLYEHVWQRIPLVTLPREIIYH